MKSRLTLCINRMERREMSITIYVGINAMVVIAGKSMARESATRRIATREALAGFLKALKWSVFSGFVIY